MIIPSDDTPRSLKALDACLRRREMLLLPHIAPLSQYAVELRRRPDVYVPDFDPLDGGVRAQILFLFEKPGRKTDPAHGGSGFISRNNDDPTAEATFHFMVAAGIPRHETITWNFIPWWNDARAMTRSERSDGRDQINRLLGMLPNLKTVVLVGRTAAAARPYLESYRTIESWHPSPLVRASYPERWREIPEVWRKAIG